jgi:hypothetical protein
MGIVANEQRFDFAYNRRVIETLFEPCFDDSFRFSSEYVARTWRTALVDNPNKFRTNLPRDWVIANRLQWGLYAVLAELGAEISGFNAAHNVDTLSFTNFPAAIREGGPTWARFWVSALLAGGINYTPGLT